MLKCRKKKDKLVVWVMSKVVYTVYAVWLMSVVLFTMNSTGEFYVASVDGFHWDDPVWKI